MTPDELAAAHRAVVVKHWRTMTDNGQPTTAMLDDLAEVAHLHARDIGGAIAVRQAGVDPVTAAKITGKPAAPAQQPRQSAP